MAAGRKTGGRVAGVPNKRTAAKSLAIAGSGLTPLEYMLGVLRDPNAPPADRMDAAKAAAPYVHAKLASVEHKGDSEKPIAHEIRWLVIDPAKA